MIIVCPSCKRQNRIPDDVRTGGEYRCAACQEFLLHDVASVASEKAMPEPRGRILNGTRASTATLLVLACAIITAAIILVLPRRWHYSSIHWGEGRELPVRSDTWTGKSEILYPGRGWRDADKPLN